MRRTLFSVVRLSFLAALAGAVYLPGCGSSNPKSYFGTNFAPPGQVFIGIASWYGPGFEGRLTASGERFNPRELTAAHRSLPFGTIVRVTNRNNGRTVDVRINDRGPFVRGRIIDLSRAAAGDLKMLAAGVVPVEVRVLKLGGR